jgi:microcystin-dependent protein
LSLLCWTVARHATATDRGGTAVPSREVFEAGHHQHGRRSMSDAFLGEIRMISWNYPPRNWAFCNGQTIAINTNQALFALLGTSYGGNGVNNFQLPNLQGRVPLGQGTGVPMGQVSGEATHTLAINEMPSHTHSLNAVQTIGVNDVNGNGEWLAGIPQGYSPPQTPASTTNIAPSSLLNAGNGQAHENRQPYLCINFVIALSGIFPSRN